MNYRHALLLSPADLGPSGTKIVDLDVETPISRIEIRFKTTKAAQGMNAGAPANISKIEIVDGSKVLYSLNGYECQALAYYSRPPGVVLDHGQHVNALSEMDVYPIDFGRNLWDEELAFIPGNFHNPQLKITYDEDVADTTVTANECEVWARIFDEKVISPLGFLSAIEHYSYTCGANNSFETISMPEDRVYRQILVRAYQAGYEPWYNIDEARFDEGTLGRIPFDYTNLETYYRMMKSVWPLIVQQVVLAPTTGANDFFLPITDYNGAIVLTGMGGTSEAFITAASGRGGKFNLQNSVTVNMTGLLGGYLPWHCYQFPMGKKDDIADWYDPAGKKPRLRLRASTGATSVTGAVVIEELFKY